VGLRRPSGKDTSPLRAGAAFLRIVLPPALLWALQLAAAWPQDGGGEASPLFQRLTPDDLAAVVAGDPRVEMVKDNGPIAAAAYKGDELAGYVYSTLDVLRAPGYSTTPFDVVAGVTLDGRITGSVVLFHREPYLINDDRRTRQLVTFLDSLK